MTLEQVAAMLTSTGLTARLVPAGIAVCSPLLLRPDQDLVACYVLAREEDHYRVEDDGLALCDASDDALAAVIRFAAHFETAWDGQQASLHRDNVAADDIPRAVLEFLVMLGRIDQMLAAA